MAIIYAQRGGVADFKCGFCEGDWPEFGPPFSSPSTDFTPPFNSHAFGVYGQGYLNLHFPLVPNLAGTLGHQWMQNALKDVTAVNDVIITNAVPLRSYLSSIYYEVTMTDPTLTGVYLTPVAYRMSYNFQTKEWTSAELGAFTNDLTAAGIEKFPIGTPAGADKVYGIAMLSQGNTVPTTFGHNIVKRDATGAPISGFDDKFGAVLLGYKVSEGDAARIQSIWRSTFAIYMSAKLHTFEGATQVG